MIADVTNVSPWDGRAESSLAIVPSRSSLIAASPIRDRHRSTASRVRCIILKSVAAQAGGVALDTLDIVEDVAKALGWIAKRHSAARPRRAHASAAA
jgi:hypothetical protein